MQERSPLYTPTVLWHPEEMNRAGEMGLVTANFTSMQELFNACTLPSLLPTTRYFYC